MKKFKSIRILERQKRLNREWLSNPGTEAMKVDDLKEIGEDIQSGSPAALRNVSRSLGRLSASYGVAREVALLDGNPNGWQQDSPFLALSLSRKRTGFAATLPTACMRRNASGKCQARTCFLPFLPS